MQRGDLAARRIVLGLDRSATRNMRRPAKLLPWRIFHTIDPEKRHSLYIVIDASARFPSNSPRARDRAILGADHWKVSRNEPRGAEGSMRITSRPAPGCRGGMTLRSARKGQVV